MGIPCITIELSEEQEAQLGPVIAKIAAAEEAGKPGMALAQVIGGNIKVFFASHEQAKEIQRAMGSPVGLTTHNSRPPA